MSDRSPAGAPCPICGRPNVEGVRPFCSKRCADVDLQRWLTGGYAIPVAEDEPSADDESGPPAGDPNTDR